MSELFFDASVYYALGSRLATDLGSVEREFTLTPRGAGTSLGGQAIGEGTIVDFRRQNRILGYDEATGRVRVEPGVIQDDLNDFLKPYGRRFAPDTSTSNRATIGGMIGNNSCGMYSCHWGTTREHVHRIRGMLADGSEVLFEPLNAEQLAAKCAQRDLEGQIYRTILDILEQHGEAILEAYPDSSLIRRNTGYALDVLYRHYQPFNPNGKPFSLVPLLCGSEGTLALFLEAELETVPLPKKHDLLCAHFSALDDAFACLPALMEYFSPAAVEMIDRPTLQAAANNPEQAENRFWLEGDPDAVLAIELFDADEAQLQALRDWLVEQRAYAVPHLQGEAIAAVWSLRKAGLGLLMGERTRKKAVAVVEDAAIPLQNLRDYYHDMRRWFEAHGVEAVYYGHASVGLIHIRPKLDLSQPEDKRLFAEVAAYSAQRVKHYRGALSGEHGDGRIRAPFLPEFFGERVYRQLVLLKRAFDPDNRLNPGVIIGDRPITENLRADLQPRVTLRTGLDWSENLSLFDAVNQCNGAAACLKSPGRGVMCPSYHATMDEPKVTRGRVNLLREALIAADPRKALSKSELRQALETCLACKACKSECPASVDMAALKMEVLYQTRDQRRLKNLMLRNMGLMLKAAQRFPGLFERLQQHPLSKSLLGLHRQARLPSSQYGVRLASHSNPQAVVLVDLYTATFRPQVLRALQTVVEALALPVRFEALDTPLRLWLSNGLLDEARVAMQQLASRWGREGLPLVGLEPSETLIWRDEARKLGIKDVPEVQLVEQWLAQQLVHNAQVLQPIAKTAWVHVHCHQKAARLHQLTPALLEQVPALEVKTLKTGCCGMAGDFGYRHPELSRKVAQKDFLPHLEQMHADDWLVASGFSCQHQAQLLAGRTALHPVEVIAHAVK
ncbi:FAD/FMN-containing dehydrogenase [Sulfurivirga caldicuralii]|uniref:FAD/FMN-containing dehydrogenase n=1 Tax=Sulfurivirga caldicuralii TaxID=364032 RepID=A0A1N6DZJ6_9GAMM|nr:FAD-binding and (Fe-S)-binding domain-containing protein [Sulfurivirga caldicuralii]SIN76200.1 FAD/FMN-containing dehydrogenase [Sulfurivirga caldicuralii]